MLWVVGTDDVCTALSVWCGVDSIGVQLVDRGGQRWTVALRYGELHSVVHLSTELSPGVGGSVGVDGTTPMIATLTRQDKISVLVELSAQGTTTHSSKPLPDGALVRLDRALARLSDHQPAVFISDVAREHFAALAERTDNTKLATAVRLMYGMYPYSVDNDTINRMHGNDERVRVDALQRGAQLMYELFAQFRSH